MDQNTCWEVLHWVLATGLFLSPVSRGSYLPTRLRCAGAKLRLHLPEQIPEIQSKLYNTHMLVHTISQTSLFSCVFHNWHVRRSRKAYGVSAFCGNSHLSDTNHPIFVVFIDYNIGPGHTTWIMSFENIISLKICSGILTGSGIIHREVIANTSQVAGKENCSCDIFSCLCTVPYAEKQKQGLNG